MGLFLNKEIIQIKLGIIMKRHIFLKNKEKMEFDDKFITMFYKHLAF